MFALEPGIHLFETDVLERLQLFEVIVAVGLLQQLLVLSYLAVVKCVQEFKLTLIILASLRLPRGWQPRFGPLPGLDNLEVFLISGGLVQVRVQDVPCGG